LHRHVALGVDTVDADFASGLGQSNGIVDAALLKVGPHVATLRKPEAAIGTGIWLGAGMVIKMSLQMMLLGKSFRA